MVALAPTAGRRLDKTGGRHPDVEKQRARVACRHRCPPRWTVYPTSGTLSARPPFCWDGALVLDVRPPRHVGHGTRTALLG